MTPKTLLQRKEVSETQWGVAAPCTSDIFKTRSHQHKPLSLKWDHRLSRESASRTGSSLKNAFKHLRNTDVISLGGGLPLSEYFPFESMDLGVLSLNSPNGHENAHLQSTKHDMSDGLSIYDLTVALNYSQGSGSAQLLRWITEHTEMVHDPPYADWQCTMTIGNTSALDMALRMFAHRGDCVLSDDYTFATAVETATPMGISFVGVEMDDQGMIPDSLWDTLENWDATARGGSPRPFLLYTVPTGQNPTGTTQSVQRRRNIYCVAQKYDLIILEDDPYYFLQLDPFVTAEEDVVVPMECHPSDQVLEMVVPSYLSMDTDGRVVRMDSFSKVICPGARVGWITASQQIVEQYKHHADTSTQSPAGLSQLALFKLLDEQWGHAGYLDWLLHIRREYTRRRNFTLAACERYLPRRVVSWKPAQAGMFQWLRVKGSSHPQAGTKTMEEIEEEIWLESIKQGALVARGSWFHVPSGRTDGDIFFRITFAAASLDNIAEAVSRFGKAVTQVYHLENHRRRDSCRQEKSPVSPNPNPPAAVDPIIKPTLPTPTTMTKITILGAGIAGLSIAAQLPKTHAITIVARDLPGDHPSSPTWASPFAGATWLGMDGSPAREQQMQRDGFAHMWKIAVAAPESSVKRVEMHDLWDDDDDDRRLEDVWYYGRMPGFRVMDGDELPEGVARGMCYMSWVLTPTVFLSWLRERLEAAGVAFKRANVRSLADLKGMGHDVLINAAGWGARFLGDVADQDVEQVRGQTVLVRTDYDKVWTRRGKDYTYVIPRGDGTAVLGGIKQYGNTDTSVDSSLRDDILRRVHEGLPNVFPEKPSEFDVVRDIVGIRPQRKTGVRVEKEELDGQTVVHAYGAPGGGYVYSFGLAREVAKLVDEIELKVPKTKL
ncbi:aromatic amino acid aminotransferase [Diplodia corticola]|uniref:aromatic-amino-acid transaminase n=1 Tax=Diplodia corticola TaxID=236234 RepID=A0A1J9RJY1_9PEZI|nr:aromatic amino acid aminotransferase [Diplodia corticola]OJD40785.1 aromatic amino acid aminotransferase [Diplodia corticola]